MSIADDDSLSVVTVSASRSSTALRQPRAIVRVNGQAVLGWISWEVVNNSYYEADTFRVSFATSQLAAPFTLSYFSSVTEAFIEILAGFPANPNAPVASELASLIYGRIDDIHIDPVNQIMELTGRDLTAVFIDNKLTTSYTNQTASAIATKLAQSHGLTPQVTTTSTDVGTYYKRDEVRMQADRSEWDMLAWLAREEGFICYVDRDTLYFEPDPRDPSNPYPILWTPASASQASPSANVMDLSFSRSLTVAKGVTVTARSPSLTKKTAVTASYPSAAKSIQAGKSSPFGGVQTYYFTMTAGQNAQQVQAYAQQMYTAIVSHAMKLEARLPADNVLDISMAIRVSGTGTAFDQIYWPREITREMSVDEGYTMTVHAQNYSPDLAPT